MPGILKSRIDLGQPRGDRLLQLRSPIGRVAPSPKMMVAIPLHDVRTILGGQPFIASKRLLTPVLVGALSEVNVPVVVRMVDIDEAEDVLTDVEPKTFIVFLPNEDEKLLRVSVD